MKTQKKNDVEFNANVALVKKSLEAVRNRLGKLYKNRRSGTRRILYH